jgi:hypothetical protein
VETTMIVIVRRAEQPDGSAGVIRNGTENPEAPTVAGRRPEGLVEFFDPPRELSASRIQPQSARGSLISSKRNSRAHYANLTCR